MTAAIFTSNTRPCSSGGACCASVALRRPNDLLLFFLLHVRIAALVLLIMPLSPPASPRLTHSAEPGTDSHPESPSRRRYITARHLIGCSRADLPAARWRFVVHGGVDGFSRLVVYLTVAGNNRAHTVLQSFIAAVEQYGLPSRVRSDKGGENADVAEFMIRSRGTDRNSHITGRSVHNQRIERMWRDVYEHALDLFYQIFTSLEDQGTLNPDNEVHLFALHRIFLPLVQQSLDSFRDAWNFHGLRTERNQSPQQLWRRYREQGPEEDPTEIPEEYGIDWNGPHSLHGGTVSVPEVQLARELSDEEVAILPAPGVSVTDALRLYVETVEVLSRILD
uniref:Integrase catalytic domain-containing protein n=1 Tax=Gasterosteus aculeatus aculeatus TaxID=481459 RepID=A0AAQ4QW99_GASAC